jgi:hypothetical protein
MEGLSRLVSESMVRYGLDRPVDYRRLRWSRWFRCESPHSLLQVPSKPGVFALAEEIVSFDTGEKHLGTAALGCPAERSSACVDEQSPVEEGDFSPVSSGPGSSWGAPSAASAEAFQNDAASATENLQRRMLAVTHFFEDDDMAFVLDRMLTKENPLRAPLNSGRYFVRFVIIEDRFQRRQIYNSLSQWLSHAAEKASGIGSHFASSLELTPATEYVPPTVATRSP